MGTGLCPVCNQPLPAFDTRRCSKCGKQVHPGCGSGQFPVFICDNCAKAPPCPICLTPLAEGESKVCKKCGRTVHERCGKHKLIGGFICNEDA